MGREDLRRPLLNCRNRPPQRPECSHRLPRCPGTTRGRCRKYANRVRWVSSYLPMDIAGAGSVKRSLDDLNREPCDQQAIVALGLALDKVGRKREAANAQLSFSKACGGYAPSVKMAVNMQLALSDYAGAAT